MNNLSSLILLRSGPLRPRLGGHHPLSLWEADDAA
jgi:hypothetical protein